MPNLRLIETINVPPRKAANDPPRITFSDDEIHAMQRAVINLFDRWAVSDEQAAILLGGIATRFPEKTLKWDADSLTFTNSKDAAGYVSKEYRKGWNVKGL